MSIRKKENHNGSKLMCDGTCIPRAEFRPRAVTDDPGGLRTLARRQGWTAHGGVVDKRLIIDLCPGCRRRPSADHLPESKL